MVEWSRFIQSVMGQWLKLLVLNVTHESIDPDNDNEDSSDDDQVKTKKKPSVVLETNADGRPLLPDSVVNSSLSFDQMHPILRDYLNINYSN